MLLQPIPAALAGAGARRSAADSTSPPPAPPHLRLRRRVLAPIRADSPSPISLSAAPSRPMKPAACTADELHYAPVDGTGWRLALWRYRPPRNAPARNHPLMLLSGVGANAVGFDLSPGASFARHMSSQGFDTWVVEVRGAGLSTRENDNPVASSSGTFEDVSGGIKPLDNESTSGAACLQNSNVSSIDFDDLGIVALDEPPLLAELSNLFDRISKLMEEAMSNQNFHEITEKISVLSNMVESSAIISPMREESLRLLKNVQGQLDSLERFVTMHLTSEYNWDFDHYLEEDIPAAMEYIRQHSKTKDGKLLAIGHSMGGILLYAMLSRSGFEGAPSDLAAIVTLASSVDYTTSNSSLKMLLPLAQPAQALNVPAVPLGTLLAAAYPWASGPPYLFSWLNSQISAQDMMHPELLSKLIFNNFCTVPAKVVLQLTTAFREGGLCNRNGTFSYKDHLRDCQTPVLALAGDKDLICPPEAVYETVKLIPKQKMMYRVFGKREGPHYAHYDLVGGRLATHEVYPCIIEFLSRYD
ncbi:hypothetical protein QOZ80_8BG0656090 [Eleusine coracana subsp. coracana]|nr:hypothetical protein QOZ80_8BG0656090 [Eleusine coracana subsp. coracana]